MYSILLEKLNEMRDVTVKISYLGTDVEHLNKDVGSIGREHLSKTVNKNKNTVIAPSPVNYVKYLS